MVLGILALGLTGLKASGLTNAQQFRGHPDSVTGETVLAAHFPAGTGTPVIVIGNASAAAPLRSAFAATPGITAVTPPVTKAGYAYLQGTLTAPPDSQAAYDTIDRVRSAVHAVPGASALVGGDTATNLDTQRASAHDRDLVIPLILAVVLVILGLLLRALVAPLILTATVVLSFAAALGVSAVFFNHVFGFGGADTAVPLYVFLFLVALGIDYNIFLMTRVREEANKSDARHGALTARRDRRGDHLGRLRARRHLRHAGHDPADDPHRNWFRGRVRHPARHDRGAVVAGHRAEPGRRPPDVVAQQAGPQTRPGTRTTSQGAHRCPDR